VPNVGTDKAWMLGAVFPEPTRYQSGRTRRLAEGGDYAEGRDCNAGTWFCWCRVGRGRSIRLTT
jgi:hypothetical protein